MHIYSDFDGVLGSATKTWILDDYVCTGRTYSPKRIIVAKTFCDKDRIAIELLNGSFTIITHDPKVSSEWARERNINHIPVPRNSSKLAYIRHKEFIYIGDSLKDYDCLAAAYMAFIPADASKLLIKKLDANNVDYIKVQSSGGQGVLEDVLIHLHNEDHIDLESLW